jgi:MFS family permease
MKSNEHNGWQAFRILWAGQTLSLLGTGMTRFALMMWAFEIDGSATTLALLGFFTTITYIIASPFAGIVVDRFDRRKVMFAADLGAGFMTLLLLGLNLSGELQIWHLYLAEGVAGACEALQEPAFFASISLLLPKKEYTRSNGMLSFGKSAARFMAPAFAGGLLPVAGLNFILGIDLLTLFLALVGLRLVTIPRPPLDESILPSKAGLLEELRFGLRYIFKHPGLRGLMLSFFMVNFFGTITYMGILSPMILTRTGGDGGVLGLVKTVMGIGGMVGGLLVSLWGGPKRKARFYLLSTLLSFLICDTMMAVSRDSTGWIIAGFLCEMTIVFIVGPYFGLWQEIVPPVIQGRVFSSREMVQVASQPIGYLLGGVLADQIFEPAMSTGNVLAVWLHPIVGSGPGAGMAVMFLCTAVLGSLTGLVGLLSPSIQALDEPDTKVIGPREELKTKAIKAM